MPDSVIHHDPHMHVVLSIHGALDLGSLHPADSCQSLQMLKSLIAYRAVLAHSLRTSFHEP
jgi:hypothetical protein